MEATGLGSTSRGRGVRDDAKAQRAVTPLTQAGRKSRGLVWEGENFAFAHVKFEVLAKHRDRELVSSPRKRRNKRWLQTEPVAK